VVYRNGLLEFLQSGPGLYAEQAQDARGHGRQYLRNGYGCIYPQKRQPPSPRINRQGIRPQEEAAEDGPDEQAAESAESEGELNRLKVESKSFPPCPTGAGKPKLIH
jgi:hypothetical protein